VIDEKVLVECAISIQPLRRLVSRRQEHTAFVVTATHSFATTRTARRAFSTSGLAEGMSGLYDKVKADVAFRREVANSCGVGFNVPANLSSIEPIEPKLESVEVAVNP
jgi:hypothetical protein